MYSLVHSRHGSARSICPCPARVRDLQPFRSLTFLVVGFVAPHTLLLFVPRGSPSRLLVAGGVPSTLAVARTQLAHEIHAAAAEDAVVLDGVAFSPGRGTGVGGGGCGGRGRGALDVVVEAFDDVARCGFFQVEGLLPVDLLLYCGLWE